MPAERKTAGRGEAPPRIGRYCGGARPHFHHRRPKVGFVVGQHRKPRHIGTCRQGLDIEVAALHHQHQVLGHGGVRRHDIHVDAKLPRDHALGIADALHAIDRISDRQRVQRGSTLTGDVMHAGGGDPRNVAGRNGATPDVGGRLDQMSLQPPARHRQKDGLDADLGHVFGKRDRLANRLFAFGEINDRAPLDPLRADLAITDQLSGMTAAAKGAVRRAWPQARDHAGDFAGADVERSDQRRALRHRSRLRRLFAIESAHASPTFFFGSFFLSASSRALAASSDNCTTSRSGSRKSTATMSLEKRWSSLSSALKVASASPTSFSGRRISMPSLSLRYQRRSPTKIAAFVTELTCGYRDNRARKSLAWVSAPLPTTSGSVRKGFET